MKFGALRMAVVAALLVISGYSVQAAAEGEAVAIYNLSGKLIGTIKVPQTPSNVCFGKDKKTLFITARKSLYSVRML